MASGHHHHHQQHHHSSSVLLSDADGQTRVVGPYLLQRTLGKGQTGLVKLGVHCVTRRTVAVKIINREKLSKSVLMKVEREIAIMKLIDHPHVLGLYDVYENNTHLFLILEHVSGGELFDYLVRKGRLSEREARRFFKQIVSAVDFCHKHAVCHRDLKPENLLLNEQRNIKVADFGMASLQMGENLLETSCGSPHYACPEVIRGEQYDGRKADTWSCGIILYALLVGALPFDDDNLRLLLEKVKRGHFVIPSYVPSGAQELLKGMVEVNPKKRITLEKVMKHPWFKGHDAKDVEPVTPMQVAVETYPLLDEDEIDPDIFHSMTSLGCFKDKRALTQSLLSQDHNEEKVVYYLLLRRKERQPSVEDEARAMVSGDQFDMPRKRIDSHCSTPNLQQYRTRSQSIGSANLDSLPTNAVSSTTAQHQPSRLSISHTPSYTPHGYYSYSSTPPVSRTAAIRKASYPDKSGSLEILPGSSQYHTLQVPSGGAGAPASPWKRKFSDKMKNFIGSPRFHRRRMEAPQDQSTEAARFSSPAKRSWFFNFRLEKEKEEVVVVYRDKTFSELKTAIIHAFAVVNCEWKIVNENTFKIKYEKSAKHKTKNVFMKTVKFTLTLLPMHARDSEGGGAGSMATGGVVEQAGLTLNLDGKTFTVAFSQTSGPTRRFRRVCEKLQAAMFLDPTAIGGSASPISPHVSRDLLGSDNPSLSSNDTLGSVPEGFEGDSVSSNNSHGNISHGNGSHDNDRGSPAARTFNGKPPRPKLLSMDSTDSD